jgi:hypothetical protein
LKTHPNVGLLAAGTKAETEAAQATKQNTVFIVLICYLNPIMRKRHEDPICTTRTRRQLFIFVLVADGSKLFF